MLILYPIGVIPFTYATSFVFSTESVAQTFTVFIHFLFGGFGPLIVYILRIIDSTMEVGDILDKVFKIVPSYCLGAAIMYDSSKERLFQRRPELKKDSDYDITLMGGNVLALCMHFVFWMLILAIIEAGAFNWIGRLAYIFPKNKIPPKTDDKLALDEDVVEEERRVEGA